jgi:hypothetical protein
MTGGRGCNRERLQPTSFDTEDRPPSVSPTRSLQPRPLMASFAFKAVLTPLLPWRDVGTLVAHDSGSASRGVVVPVVVASYDAVG